MEDMSLTDLGRVWEDLPCSVLGGTVVIGGLVFLILYKIMGQKTSTRKEYPKDTVVFHNVPAGPNTPSLAPFGMKLETYFRMAKIPYETIVSFERSPKGKVGWIEFNGEAVADSESSIEFLNKEMKINLNSHLTPEQRGVGRAFKKMFEENTYWVLVLNRWVFDETQGIQNFLNFPWYVRWYFRRTLFQKACGQGIGVHSEEEIYNIMRLDLSALSQYLGTKKFLFGDQACGYDCAIFGILAPCLWEGFGGQVSSIVKEYPNLCDYCENIKTEFWPDWADCTAEGRKKKIQSEQD